ncbi:MAG: glycosyltransferase WbuB [Opitutus sp.]|nr:glycosyltransferase WbuB [Opitutus sp.]
MRVLYFHQHFTTPDGSGGTRSYEFARALVERGHSVTMVCGRSERSALDLSWDAKRKWSRGVIDGIDVIALPLNYSNRDSLLRRAWLFLHFAWRGVVLALPENYDLLFASSTPLTAAIPGIAMKLCCRGKPFVFEVRDLWPELPRALGMKNPIALGGMSALEWMAYRCADACIGLSPGIVDGIKRRALKGRVVEMIPNGCDLDLFTPAQREKLKLPGIEAGDFVAGFTGAHGIANGLDAVLDAAAELKRRGRCDIKLVLIGDGKCKDGLVARAKAEGLDNCLFFPPVKKTDLSRITASFDCGMQILADVPAFYYGTSPNKFFDYISAGLPILINYPGWLAELVRANDCGESVPPRNPVAFADALCRLADKRSQLTVQGSRARQLAEREFARANLARQFVERIERTSRGCH